MNYKIEKEDKIYYYNVTYDIEKLKEIFEELKKYGYICIGSARICGEITKWPATDKIIKKRIISMFKKEKVHINDTINPETIIHHTENNSDYVTYNYSYNKLPDLYDYIDLIINNRSILDYTRLFGKVSEERTGTLNMFYVAAHWDQLVLEGILNYVNSRELTNHDSVNDAKEYDYKRLNELYKRTLECFKFNLIAIKENVDVQEEIDGLSIQKKLIK